MLPVSLHSTYTTGKMCWVAPANSLGSLGSWFFCLASEIKSESHENSNFGLSGL